MSVDFGEGVQMGPVHQNDAKYDQEVEVEDIGDSQGEPQDNAQHTEPRVAVSTVASRGIGLQGVSPLRESLSIESYAPLAVDGEVS